MRSVPSARCRALFASLVLVLLAGSAAAQPAFTTFETGQVRPLALSPDGTRLFAVNTPDNRLEIFRVGSGGIAVHAGRCRSASSRSPSPRATNGEVWVVNHLSDSVSIVDVAATPPRVMRTLLVGDEPRDIVFAGTGSARSRAFITTAHRGQNSPVGSAAHDRRASAAPTSGCSTRPTSAPRSAARRSRIVTLFGDTPRALAVTPDGNTVYAAVFHSGNQTTTRQRRRRSATAATTSARASRSAGVAMPGGLPGPDTDAHRRAGARDRPDRQVQQGDQQLARRARPQLEQRACKFNLPDQDVFAIDATPTTPGGRSAPSPSVGTILFNMAVNPVNGKVYVTNTEARNEVRFEGPGRLRRHAPCGATCTRRASRVLERHRHRDAAPPEQAHRLLRCVPAPPGAKDDTASRRRPAWRSTAATARRSTWRPSAPSKVGVFDTAAARERHLRAERREPHRRERRRPERPGARRGARPALRADALRQRASRWSTPPTRAEIAHVALLQPGAAERRGRAAVPLRRQPHARATARRPARAATSSATSTASPGISATRTTQTHQQPDPDQPRDRRDSAARRSTSTR